MGHEIFLRIFVGVLKFLKIFSWGIKVFGTQSCGESKETKNH